MRLGETDTTLIRVPIAIHNTAGVLAGGCSPSSGQLLTSLNGAALSTAAGTLINFGSEGYYYQGTVGDASVEGILVVCVTGVSGFRTEMAFQPVVGSGTAVGIPIVIYDTSGNLKTGFSPTSGQLKTTNDGVAFVNAPGTFSEMGFGGYFYAHTTSPGGFVMLRAAAGSILTALAFGGSEVADCPSGPGPGSGGTPVVTIVTSLPPSTATTPVVITVEPGGDQPIRRAWIDLHFPGIVGDEVVHNSNRYGAYYTSGINTRTTSGDGGYTFTILRDGGWPVGSFPLATSFDVFAVDTEGNST